MVSFDDTLKNFKLHLDEAELFYKQKLMDTPLIQEVVTILLRH
jgi:hypothetical protein